MKYFLPLLMSFALPVWADWTSVAETLEGVKFSLDYSTIRKDGQFRKVWEVANFPSPENIDGAVYLSVRARAEYDCKEEKKRNLTTTAHSGLFAQGNMVWSSDTPTMWTYAPPKSAVYELLRQVCSASVR
jgi:hypothetical protein